MWQVIGLSFVLSQRAHGPIATSLLRQNDAVVAFWHNNDVIITSCVRWDTHSLDCYTILAGWPLRVVQLRYICVTRRRQTQARGAWHTTVPRTYNRENIVYMFTLVCFLQAHVAPNSLTTSTLWSILAVQIQVVWFLQTYENFGSTI